MGFQIASNLGQIVLATSIFGAVSESFVSSFSQDWKFCMASVAIVAFGADLVLVVMQDQI